MTTKKEIEFGAFFAAGLIIFCLLLISSRLGSIARSLEVLASPPAEKTNGVH